MGGPVDRLAIEPHRTGGAAVVDISLRHVWVRHCGLVHFLLKPACIAHPPPALSSSSRLVVPHTGVGALEAVGQVDERYVTTDLRQVDEDLDRKAGAGLPESRGACEHLRDLREVRVVSSMEVHVGIAEER